MQIGGVMHASLFLAIRISASHIYPGVENLILHNQVTLPKMPRECCTLVVLELTRKVVK